MEILSRILLGFLYAFLTAIGFSFLISLTVCFGAEPQVNAVADRVCPLFGILVGSYFATRRHSWEMGAGIGFLFVLLWAGFWLNVMGRLSPDLWFKEGMPHLLLAHIGWWGAAILTGIVGNWISGKPRVFLMVFVATFVCLAFLIKLVSARIERSVKSGNLAVPGYNVQREATTIDGTIVYSVSFDFKKQPFFNPRIYDCDSDDALPYDDSNTSYMGQDIHALVQKLNQRSKSQRERTLCLVNGGFFGASGLSVAHHEEPIVQDGHVAYNVDLLRPKDQGCFFAVNSLASIQAGQPRFLMLPSIPWGRLQTFQTVLGGVRPLRVDGKSLLLKPGAGTTGLRCSRTSIGWSADGDTLYILVVYDPDGELASQIQRKMHWPQTGGWDVRQVQQYWENKQIPFAVLFDGGESTQLAYLKAEDAYGYVNAGYQYSFTVGYLFQRPLVVNLPILPPSEAHRGVLNYFYVGGPRSF
jgi:hypothetical protein